MVRPEMAAAILAVVIVVVLVLVYRTRIMAWMKSHEGFASEYYADVNAPGFDERKYILQAKTQGRWRPILPSLQAGARAPRSTEGGRMGAPVFTNEALAQAMQDNMHPTDTAYTHTYSFNPEQSYVGADDPYHDPAAAMDYQNYVAGKALAPQTFQTHGKWASEVMPYSSTALKVDDMDEAVYVSTSNGHGITAFRPNTPKQHANMLQVTEADPFLYAAQSKEFNFNSSDTPIMCGGNPV